MKTDIESLLAQRREIDRALFERHGKDAAILFTDIVGSTAFYERRGDIEGLARVRRHNELLFPIVAAHDGRVIKTIGDSIMAVFPTANAAVACARALHRALLGDTSDEPLRIRIGIHAGRVLQDGDDVFGDAVNTAARVASAAEGDEVLVSRAVVEALDPAQRSAAIPKGPLTLKGKAEPVDAFLIPWRDNSVGAATTGELFVLEIARGPQGLRIAALDGGADKGTVKPTADVALAPDALQELAAPFAALAHDGGDAAYREALAQRGRALFDRALSPRAQERLRATSVRNLRLMLDDDLVHVPWELMHDGAEHLATKFAIGRLVAARATSSPARPLGRGPIVVVANPSGDLPAAAEEGETIAALLSSSKERIELVRGPIDRATLLQKLDGASALHFAGHATDDDGGALIVRDGSVRADEIAAAFGATAPAFVFVNGCRSSIARGWTARSIAQALLLHGVPHALSPSWSVPDADALAFALRFYEACLQGSSVGEAVRRARLALRVDPRHALSFAGYVLYGDPRALPPFSPTSTMRAPVRSSPSAASPPPKSGVPTRLVVTGAVIVLVGFLEMGYLQRRVRPVENEPPAALARPPAPALPAAAATSPPTTTPPTTTSSTTATQVATNRTGPVRVSVMPFHGAGKDEALAFLQDGLAEAVVTDLAGVGGVRLVERGQIDVDISEIDFAQTKYVDPATRARIGQIAGAEVAVLGSWQKAGDALRLTARLVDVESGEVLATAKVDGKTAAPFALQDEIGARVREQLPAVVARLRPVR